MKPSFSVLISDGESDYALFAAHCLAQCLNVKIYVLCEQSWSPIRFSRYCRCIMHRPSAPDDVMTLKDLAEILRKNKIDVLLPTGTNGISFVLAHQEALSKLVALPPMPDRTSFEIANNKWLLSQFLEEHNIPGPKTILVTESTTSKRLEDLAYPVLLKPTGAGGGKGVKRFETPADIQRFLDTKDLKKIQGKFILQSFLQGRDVDFSVLSIRGENLAVTIQRGIIPSKHKFAPPVAIEFIKDIRFLDASQQLFSALGWSGYAHVDTLWEMNENRINILDINARFWGSLRGSLVAGVNFPYLACLAALHIPFAPPDYELVHFYNSKTAFDKILFTRQGNASEHRISFQETGLRFLLLDPLAEILRGI